MTSQFTDFPSGGQVTPSLFPGMAEPPETAAAAKGGGGRVPGELILQGPTPARWDLQWL